MLTNESSNTCITSPSTQYMNVSGCPPCSWNVASLPLVDQMPCPCAGKLSENSQVHDTAGSPEQVARLLGRGVLGEFVHGRIDHRRGGFGVPVLSESVSKSACAFPTMSNAALVLASSASAMRIALKPSAMVRMCPSNSPSDTEGAS